MIKSVSFSWPRYLFIGVGVFIGCFWMIHAYMALIHQPAVMGYYIVLLSPGAAVLYLVLRFPESVLPHGVGLLLLGGISLLLIGINRIPLQLGLAFGLPVLVLGAAGLTWGKKIRLKE